MADFTGFYFDNVHSSAYGLVRTSDGSRYTEGLIPEFEDREIELVGGDGSLYEGRRFKKTPFTIEVAFDHMTETQLRDLRKWLGTDELKPFRFDERPYKTYWVKPSRKPELTYVCFMEEDENYEEGTYIGSSSDTHKIRIYKGEGELEFTAYDPYAYCVDRTTDIISGRWINYIEKQNEFKLLDESELRKEKEFFMNALGKEYQENSEGYPVFLNKINWQNSDSYNPLVEGGEDLSNEWGVAVDLKDSYALQDYNTFTFGAAINEPGTDFFGVGTGHISSQYVANLYNPGDFETDFQLYLNLAQPTPSAQKKPIEQDSVVNIYISQNERVLYSFSFNTKSLSENDRIVLDTKTHSLIVYAYKNSTYQKTLRYDLIRSTDFPKIPVGNSKIKITRTINTVNGVSPSENNNTANIKAGTGAYVINDKVTVALGKHDDVKGGIYVPHIKYNYKFY